MRNAVLFFTCVLIVIAGCGEKSQTQEKSDAPPITLTVGHVGHDHQLALFVAALEGERFKKAGVPYLREIKPREVYELIDGDKKLALLRFVKVGGGSRMPAAMTRGELDIGLGGVAAVAKFADKGQPFKIICPLQTDGDMLVMRTGSEINDWNSFVAATKKGGKPLMIGYKAPAVVAKLVFVGALKAAGIRYSNNASDKDARVILINMMSEKSPLPLLESGAIDGFVMHQPPVAVAVHKKLGKVVAELRDLPPAGKWIDHPCCCVSATVETLENHPDAVKAFTKCIILATKLIQDQQDTAIDCATRWTKNPREVEVMSVPTISYIAEPTDSWISGMKTWVALMQDTGTFKGKYATISPDDFIQDVCYFRLYNEARNELWSAGLLNK